MGLGSTPCDTSLDSMERTLMMKIVTKDDSAIVDYNLNKGDKSKPVVCSAIDLFREHIGLLFCCMYDAIHTGSLTSPAFVLMQSCLGLVNVHHGLTPCQKTRARTLNYPI